MSVRMEFEEVVFGEYVIMEVLLLHFAHEDVRKLSVGGMMTPKLGTKLASTKRFFIGKNIAFMPL